MLSSGKGKARCGWRGAPGAWKGHSASSVPLLVCGSYLLLEEDFTAREAQLLVWAHPLLPGPALRNLLELEAGCSLARRMALK